LQGALKGFLSGGEDADFYYNRNGLISSSGGRAKSRALLMAVGRPDHPMKSRFGTGAEESLASPEEYASESDSQALHTLAEEIAQEFAPRLEQTAVVLYDRDPGYLQAQWCVTPQALAEARRLFPGGAAGLHQVLHLCRLDRDGGTQVVASVPQDSDASEGAGEDGFALPGDGAEYRCELGLESDTGGWLLLARSNRVRLAGRQRSPSRTTPVPDDPQARNAPPATAEEPSESGDIPVEAALAAVGEPLYPVFPNLESDDAPPAEHPTRPERTPGRTRSRDRRSEPPSGVHQGPAPHSKPHDAPLPGKHPASLEKASDRAGPRDRRPESPFGVHQDSSPHLKPDDAPSPGKHPPSMEKVLGRAGPGDREVEYPPGVPPYLVSYPKSGDTPPGHSAPLAEAPRHETPGQAGLGDQGPEPPPGIHQGSAPHSKPHDAPPPRKHPAFLEKAPDRARPGDREPEYPPGVPPYLVSYPGSGDAPPGHSAPLVEAPRQETPGQARSGNQEPEFLSGNSHDPAPDPETVAEIPSDAPVEAALAAVGGPLYPVFPNLEADDAPPGHSTSLEEVPGQAWLQDRGAEFPSGILQDSVSYQETTDDLPPGALLVDMPPPLLPSSPGLSPGTDAMPGPLYDPRAALSSAVLGTSPSLPDLEIHAELIVQGRAAADSTIDLFGHPIAVGADGRFYIRRSLDISALESLAVGGGLLPWQETAGHG